MKTRYAWFGAGLALGLVPILVAAQADMAKKPASRITGKTLMVPSEMKWMPLEGIEGAMQCAVFGDPTKEAHRVFFKFPVGMKAPLHTHTSGDRGVIVSGTLAIGLDGGTPKKLPPGSYFSMAAGTKHTTMVDGDQPCIFYIEREGAFDVVAVESAGAAK
jgi:quercetin dioxygenase-like cupin family protein